MDILINNLNDIYIMSTLLAILLLLIISLYNMFKIRSLSKKYNRFIKGFGDTNIEQSLEKFMIRVEEVYQRGKEIENHCNQIERTLINCFQKVGIVRYNAFENVGSDLSFAIALLNSNDDGVLINGIYTRDSCATYAKPIVKGKSKYVLSAEEEQALDIAKKYGRERE